MIYILMPIDNGVVAINPETITGFVVIPAPTVTLTITTNEVISNWTISNVAVLDKEGNETKAKRQHTATRVMNNRLEVTKAEDISRFLSRMYKDMFITLDDVHMLKAKCVKDLAIYRNSISDAIIETDKVQEELNEKKAELVDKIDKTDAHNVRDYLNKQFETLNAEIDNIVKRRKALEDKATKAIGDIDSLELMFNNVVV